jgi:hypothetical protein
MNISFCNIINAKRKLQYICVHCRKTVFWHEVCYIDVMFAMASYITLPVVRIHAEEPFILAGDKVTNFG